MDLLNMTNMAQINEFVEKTRAMGFKNDLELI